MAYFIRIAQITRQGAPHRTVPGRRQLPHCVYWQDLRRRRNGKARSGGERECGDADRDGQRYAALTAFWRSTFEFRDRKRFACQKRRTPNIHELWPPRCDSHCRWPSNVSTASVVMLMSRRQQQRQRSKNTSSRSSTSTASTAIGIQHLQYERWERRAPITNTSSRRAATARRCLRIQWSR